MRLFVSLAGASLVAGLVAGTPALAGLEFCNETDRKRTIAIGYSKDKIWTSEGWWGLQPGECKTLVGGDLEQRYYYYRATARGVPFKGENFFFCTETQPFTIQGDEGCEARGYDRVAFRKIDTGKSAKHFTLTLTSASPAAEVLPEPGRYGEPISITGILRGCRADNDPPICEIETDEWIYVVPKDDRTPRQVYAQLGTVAAGHTVTVQGDLLGYGDVTADISARSVTVQSAPTVVAQAGGLEGGWQSLDDAESVIQFAEGRYLSFYGGELIEQGAYVFPNSCASGGKGLSVTIEGDPEPYCYAVDTLNGASLDMIYLPRGNVLRYRRLGR